MQLDQGLCPYVATSSEGTKPRTLRATGQSAGQYMLVLRNQGETDESLSHQIVFTAAARAMRSE